MTPLYATLAFGPAGTRPLVSSGVEVSEKNVAVTAFGPAENEEGVLLRLWEIAGRSVKCEVKLPQGFGLRSATPVDLRNQKAGKAIRIKNGKFSIECPGNRPVTVVLKQEPGAGGQGAE